MGPEEEDEEGYVVMTASGTDIRKRDIVRNYSNRMLRKVRCEQDTHIYPVYQVLGFFRPPCIALTQPNQPLSCLGSSVVADLPSKQCDVGSSST